MERNRKREKRLLTISSEGVKIHSHYAKTKAVQRDFLLYSYGLIDYAIRDTNWHQLRARSHLWRQRQIFIILMLSWNGFCTQQGWQWQWNKNAFQWDAYRPLVDRIPACTDQGVCVSQHAMGQTPPFGQTDNCENITFANFVCGGRGVKIGSYGNKWRCSHCTNNSMEKYL